VLLCLLSAGCDSREELTRVDTDKEATRILVELSRNGIAQPDKVEKKEQRKTAYGITVPRAELARAREVLLHADLPRESHGGYRGMIEQGGLIPTKTEERAKLMYAMAEELARTFETYDRVVSARVHIALPEKDPLMRDATTRPTATAMVLIKYAPVPEPAPATADAGTDAGGQPAAAVAPAATQSASRGGARDEFPDAPVHPEEVRQMVARSVEGLTPASVFVAYSRTASVPPAAAAAAPAGGGAVPTATAGVVDRGLLIKLLAAVALFGVISIFLTAMLVREKRRQRLHALSTSYADESMERAGV
jgi:type III secretion system YscJ/HrcJ family lipoprotein